MKPHFVVIAVMLICVSAISKSATDVTSTIVRFKLPPVAEHFSRAQLQTIANRARESTVDKTHQTVSVVEILNQSGSVIATFTY